MRHSYRRRWHPRRLVRFARPMVHPELHRVRMMTNSEYPHRGEIPPELRREVPGPDGVRHALVSHIKQLIADGVYDSPERWALAEEKLFDHLEQQDS